MSMEGERKRYLLALARHQRKTAEEEQNRIKEATNLTKNLIFSNTIPSCLPFFQSWHYDLYKKRKLMRTLHQQKKNVKKRLLNKVEAQNRYCNKESKNQTAYLLYFKRLYQPGYLNFYQEPKFLIKTSYEKSVDIPTIKNELTTLSCNLKRIYH